MAAATGLAVVADTAVEVAAGKVVAAEGSVGKAVASVAARAAGPRAAMAEVEPVVLLQYNLYQCVEQQVIPYQLVAVEL